MPSSDGLRALFIYYRVPVARADEALHAVLSMQGLLTQRWSGLQARLLRRTDDAHHAALEETWMEVYEHPSGVDVLCEKMIAEQSSMLPSGLIGARHVESFSAVSALPLGVGKPLRSQES